MRQITATGQTVDEAVQSALRQLNITEDQAEIEVIDEGKKGLLGLFGSKPAIVKVAKAQESVEELPAKEVELEEDPVEKVQKYVEKIIAEFEVEVNVKAEVEQNVVTLQLTGEKIALLIGKRGQTLNAIQYLAQLAIHQYADKYYTVVVDAEGYRERRRETLISLADRLADRASQTKRDVKIEPMPSFERKVIHTALQNRKDVETDSQGTEPNRYVVIKPK
ncbi:RNA-binding cell elongation regulator Jag/EloR [Gracilibacillus thailandensis]|uniref:RNA-binding protein KhpB n=1 Tax=Gracilibacillus thailandensis TaxID=563735 RepID=A0A6N7R3G7_9BACI|nr:RNA-binding cell elongation regulator Jag/EloR [Gracilibacillus thailandensis]MRI67716.1 KH domain-containing protein [Gracilibacillus thailandensis]